MKDKKIREKEIGRDFIVLHNVTTSKIQILPIVRL